jgi:hypothetical protein
MNLSRKSIVQLQKIFFEVYPLDGIDPLNCQWVKVNGLILLAGFLGLPSRHCANETYLSLLEEGEVKNLTIRNQLIRNFFAYKKYPYILTHLLLSFFLKPLFFVPLHILKIAVSLPLHSIKLIVEFLPLVLIEFCWPRLQKKWDEKNYAIRFCCLVFSPFILFSIPLLWWGRSLTSPINNVRYAWRWGAKCAGETKPYTQKQLFLKTGYAFFFALLSVISTSLTAIFFLPWILQLISAMFFPQIITHLSPLVFSFFKMLGSFILYYEPPLIATLISEPIWIGLCAAGVALMWLFEPLETDILRPCRDYYFDEKRPISHDFKEQEETDLARWNSQKIPALHTSAPTDPRLFRSTFLPSGMMRAKNHVYVKEISPPRGLLHDL